MNTSPWPQEVVGKAMEEITTSNNSNKVTTTTKAQPSTSVERKVRPQKEQALNCPRCNSTNTKFCYYNNYSLTQPRYFCKTCRRYWTEGGSLRNIPVGGGSRKNKRPASIAFPSSNTSKIKLPDLVTPLTNPNSSKIHDQDLNLGCFPSSLSDFMHLPIPHHERPLMNPNFMMMAPMHISDPNSVFPSGFNLNGDFKPALNFSLDGLSTAGGLHGGMQDSSAVNGGRILFPFDNLKTTTNPTSSTTADHQNHNTDNTHQQGDSTGYWTGILGGAGSW